jgi:hypothetical protein
VLTNSLSHPLITLKTESCYVLPEYPETHLQGYTYIVPADPSDLKEPQNIIKKVRTIY